MEIGKKLKSLRIKHGLTQSELADRSEVSKGFISLLENDLTSPSVSTLIDILEVFSLSISEFFVDVEIEDEVVYSRKNYCEVDEDDYRISWLVSDAQTKMMEPLLFELSPHSKTKIYEPNESEFFGYVLKGAIVIQIGEKSYRVAKGDSFYFSRPDNQYFVSNASKLSSEFIWVSNPPVF